MNLKTIIFIASTLICGLLNGQEKEVNLNQLLAPSSPAFNLLGISPETIERPTNPTDFALSLNNASQNLSTIPSNYAMEVAPFWLLNAKKMRWENFIGTKFGDNIQQSSIVSVGTTTTLSKIDSSKISQIAIGFKISLLRGKTNDEYKTWKDSVDKILNQINISYQSILDSLIKKDKVYQELMKSVMDSTKDFETKQKIEEIAKKFRRETIEPKARSILYLKTDSVKNNYITKLAKSTNFTRVGWKLDFAGGCVLDFPKSDYYYGRTSKAALWVTGGYDDPTKASFFGTIRLNSDYYTSMINDSGQVIPFINSSLLNFDAGLKLIYNLSEKFYISTELIIRNPIVPNKKIFEANQISYQKNTERWTVALNYNVANNQNVSFTFGKNFDNKFEGKNSLIAFLSYAIGIGSSRPTK
ncbi:MAG: hypothetical protein JNJ41_12980 [Bacteroidia bacterium]|nr:hypothetical protein [Bacteroidia bacterium]